MEYICKTCKGKLPKNIKLFIERGKKTRFKKGMIQETKFHLDKDLLNDLYTHQNKSMEDISAILGVCSSTVFNYLVEYNIPRRGKGFQPGNGVQVGEKHYNWRGGITCEPYCKGWTNILKEFIKERDGYICLNPYCYKGNIILSVHHIDYDKKNCGPKNLITICRSCNTRANKDRRWHKAWYQTILSKRYGYKYGDKK